MAKSILTLVLDGVKPLNRSIDLPFKWQPRGYQQKLWNFLRGGGKRAAASWHRRAGKDAVYLHHNACAAFEHVGNYWYLLPEYNQCRKAIWDAVNPHTGQKRLDEVFPREIRAKTLNQEMKIELLNGSTWQLMGSDNYDALVGSTPYGITFSEYGLSNPAAWGFLSPILMENGGWAIFNSTPRGKNHFYKMIKHAMRDDNDWFGEILTADQTGIFTQEDLQEELERLKSEHGDAYGEALWLQEYYCSFEAAIPGSIWGSQIHKLERAGRVCDVPHEEGYPVHTVWDLGRSDFTSVWFYQVIGNELRIIDFYQASFKEIPDHAQMLRDKAATLGYIYGIHWMPHDAFPTRLGMGGKSMMQQFLDEQIGKIARVPDMGRDKGIRAAGVTFDRAYFDRTRCDDGLENLKSYHRKYDEKLKTFSNEPVHDHNSHAADAWRYLALTWQLAREKVPELTQAQKFNQGNITHVNFGQIKKNHFEKKRREREYGKFD